MINMVGKNANVIREYYDDKKNHLSREAKSNIRKLINAVAGAEAIMFLQRFQDEKLYSIENICEAFDFKPQFVERNLVKHIDFKAMVLKSDVRCALKKMLNEVIDREAKSWFCSTNVAEEQLNVAVQEVTVSLEQARSCLELLQKKKKTLIFEKDLGEFISKNFILIVDGEKFVPSADVFDAVWLSVDSLKKKLELVHNVQIYRKINTPSQGYVKLEYLNYNNSKRPNVARYTKIH